MILESNEFSPTLDKSLIGAAGVHRVAAELSLRGLIALPTIRNTAGTDIVATNPACTWSAHLQVKTSRSRVRFWPIGKHFDSWTGPNNYYVFLRWLDRERTFEIFCESSAAVAAQARITLKKEKAKRGGAAWAPCFVLRFKTDASGKTYRILSGESLEENKNRLRQNWRDFGPISK